MPSLTDQQLVAVFRRDVSVVLSSGAGCGKTHVLTQRYLSHLEVDGAEVSQIVAITFTDRAAREMRRRIREMLSAKLQAAVADDDIARWEQHLRGLETAHISTIHAFCANLLRQHAVEAGLDPRFDVLEDVLAVNYENDALRNSLQHLLTAPTQAGEDLQELILLFGWKPVVTTVRHLLQDWQPENHRAWLEQTPGECAARQMRFAKEVLLPRYVHYLITAEPKIARCLWLLNNTTCTGPKMAAKVATILTGLPQLGAAGDLGEAVKELTEAAKVVGTERDKAWPSKDVYEIVKSTLGDFRKALPDRLQYFLEEPTDIEAAVLVGQRFLRVTKEVAREYTRLKRRHAVVDFQDLLLRARDLLRDHADVRERLQRRFHYLLIDELQDTDPVQMEFVEHLSGLGLTGGKLFAVGDHSQSIYRFRGADVQLFQTLRRQMPNDGQLGLTLNFRSQPAILQFTNALLGPVGDKALSNGLEDYEPLVAHHPQINSSACVEFLWSPREKESVTEARRIEADWIARRIANMVQTQAKLVVDRSGDEETLRAVQPGDVVLLFRSMSNVQLYETALREYGLDYYLVGGRAFFAQQEIYDLLNLLRALENPQDAVCLVGTLRSPFCCLSDEALFVLSRYKGGIWVALHDSSVIAKLPADQQERARRACEHLNRWRGLKNRLPIARLLGEILHDSGFDAALQFEFLGERKLANLWKLVDMARSFDRSGLFGLAEFIARLADLVRSQPREEQAATQPENANVVRLMTIHQAKGLEFPVVIIPDMAAQKTGQRFAAAAWETNLGCIVRPPQDDTPPFSDYPWRIYEASEAVADWREELRTLYVACTRAQDYLIFSASMPINFVPQNPWMLMLGQRFDIRTGSYLVTNSETDYIPPIRITEELPPAEVIETIKTDVAPTIAPLAELPQPVSAGNVSDQFHWDEEDGSDRNEWPVR